MVWGAGVYTCLTLMATKKLQQLHTYVTYLIQDGKLNDLASQQKLRNLEIAHWYRTISGCFPI